MDPKKEAICNALRAWIHQRPGLDPRNYGSAADYRSDYRRIYRHLHDARQMLRAVELAHGITGDALEGAFRAYCGRLQLMVEPIHMAGEPPRYRATLDYCTSQYWPIEYRAAACAVLASTLWDYARGHCMPAPDPAEDPHAPRTYAGMSAGAWLRGRFLREFGRGLASRWFD